MRKFEKTFIHSFEKKIFAKFTGDIKDLLKDLAFASCR